MDDLLKFKWRPGEERQAASSTNTDGGDEGGDPHGGGNWGYSRGYGFRGMMK
jgi:hypothetical protein